MEFLRVKRVRASAVLPRRATDGSAGYDLYACVDSPVTVRPHECAAIPTGIAISLPDNSAAAFVFARSGLSVKHGLAPANCVGVIDSDYRGEIIVNLVNRLESEYTIEPGERVAQLVIMPVLTPELTEADTLDETARGGGGFGSTGRL